MPHSPTRRTLLGLAVGLGLAGLCGAAEALRAGWGDLLAVGLILVVGFPHGAADLGTLRDLRLGRGKAARLGLYLAAMGATAALWLLAPALGLTAFVATAVLHFGQDQAAALGPAGADLTRGQQWGYALAWGAFAVGAPLAWHPAEFAPVTAAMLGEVPDPTALRAAAAVATAAGVLALGFAGWRLARAATGSAGRRRWGAEVALLAALAAAYVALPGLWGFAAFFVGVHSGTSIANQLRWRGRSVDRQGVGAFLREGAPYAALAVLGVAGVAVADVGLELTPAWLATFFVLVSVVTTPHAAVVFLAAERHAGAEEATARIPPARV